MPSPLALALTLAATVAVAADDINRIERLATCQDSWFEFKDDPVKSQAFSQTFISSFVQKGTSGTFTPKSTFVVAELPVIEAHPETMGMGVGFSVVLDGTFENARANVEKVVGQKLKDCQTGDGMRMCGLEFAPKKTLMVMSDDGGKSGRALVGCYYFYEK
jgi:hypothetical protein